MSDKIVLTSKHLPPPMGVWSHAVKVPEGRTLIFPSGFTSRDAKLRPCFQNPRASRSQSEVLLVGGLNEVVERGIVKNGPPRGKRLRLTVYLRVGVVNPLRGNGSRRARIARPHFAAVVPPIR